MCSASSQYGDISQPVALSDGVALVLDPMVPSDPFLFDSFEKANWQYSDFCGAAKVHHTRTNVAKCWSEAS